MVNILKNEDPIEFTNKVLEKEKVFKEKQMHFSIEGNIKNSSIS